MTVLVALSLAILVGFAAIGVDVGRMYIVRERIYSAADAAALAGVQFLPYDPDEAVATAVEFLAKNGMAAGATSVTIDPGNGRKLRVQVGLNVEMTFARVLGIGQLQVTGLSSAERLNATAVSHVVPLSVSRDQNFSYGSLMTLKKGPGGQVSPGNFGALALGGSGASQYRENLQYGYAEWISIGDWLRTEPGNMAGPTRTAVEYRIGLDPYATFDQVDRNSPRLVNIPVIDTYPNGRGEVQVVGFAVFFLEDSDGHGELAGRFLRFDVLGRGDLGAPDYGAYITKLAR